VDTDKLKTAIEFGRERSGIEFKSAGRRDDKNFLARVVRAVLGMSNRRDGGYVIVGVEETEGALVPQGLSPDDLRTWTPDHVGDAFAVYADPSVQFTVTTPSIGAKAFVVIRVEEFAEMPVLCKKGYNRGQDVILREGACYIRSRRKPETVEVSTIADMRDLLELATDKALRRFMERARGSGLMSSFTKTVPSSRDLFDKQVADFS